MTPLLRRVLALALVALCAAGCGGASTSAEAPAAAEAPARAARIWSIAVGVSKYRQADISLEFANRDAIAMDAFFASPEGGSVPAERRVLLVDEQATRSAALTALNDVARRTAPEDMLVLFLAMHGVPDGGGDLYFLTHDTDPKQLVGTGLPQRDVEYVLRRAQAQRVVLLADACHAGAAGRGAFRNSRGLELAETNRLVAALGESKPGTAVLMATSATESSVEAERWGGGHGVFTHFLLMGLAGQADADANRVVTVRELYDFVYRKVSEDTQGQQHPELTGQFDNRMPLALVAAAGRREASQRPPPVQPAPAQPASAPVALTPAPQLSPPSPSNAPSAQPAAAPAPTSAPQPQPPHAPSAPPPKAPALSADQLIDNERDPRWPWSHPRPRDKVEGELQYLTALLPKLKRDDTDRAVRMSELASCHLEMAAYAHADATNPSVAIDDRARSRKREEDHHRTIVTLLLLYRQEFVESRRSGGGFMNGDLDSSYYLGVEYEYLGDFASARRWFSQTLQGGGPDEDNALHRLARFGLAELVRREAQADRSKVAQVEKAYLDVMSSDNLRTGASYRIATASYYRIAKMYEALGDRILAKNYYRKFTAGTAFMEFIPDWAK